MLSNFRHATTWNACVLVYRICYRTYLKKTDVEDGNLNEIPRKKSCRNNIFLHCKKHSTEFHDKWHIDSENCEYYINLTSNSELYCAKELEGRSRTQDITTYITNISLDLMLHWIYCKI